MNQIDEDKKGPPKPDAKQGDAQGYIPKSTITAFNCRENGMKEMFCPCL
jgi:hypothetical protein